MDVKPIYVQTVCIYILSSVYWLNTSTGKAYLSLGDYSWLTILRGHLELCDSSVVTSAQILPGTTIT
jgi:hypothetical protein